MQDGVVGRDQGVPDPDGILAPALVTEMVTGQGRKWWTRRSAGMWQWCPSWGIMVRLSVNGCKACRKVQWD